MAAKGSRRAAAIAGLGLEEERADVRAAARARKRAGGEEGEDEEKRLEDGGELAAVGFRDVEGVPGGGEEDEKTEGGDLEGGGNAFAGEERAAGEQDNGGGGEGEDLYFGAGEHFAIVGDDFGEARVEDVGQGGGARSCGSWGGRGGWR